MISDRVAKRTEAAWKFAGEIGDSPLVQEAPALVRSNGLDKAMALWLSGGADGKGQDLARELSSWLGRSDDTSGYWSGKEKPIEILDQLIGLSPYVVEIIAAESESFLVELKNAVAAQSGNPSTEGEDE